MQVTRQQAAALLEQCAQLRVPLGERDSAAVDEIVYWPAGISQITGKRTGARLVISVTGARRQSPESSDGWRAAVSAWDEKPTSCTFDADALERDGVDLSAYKASK